MAKKKAYAEAGVSIEAGNEFVADIQHHLRRTFGPRVVEMPKGFAGMFRLDHDRKLSAKEYRDPVLVACTDGVGTKLKLAEVTGIHNTVGIDLVAMSVNDAVCCGAEPLFFLDYVAMPKDDPSLLEQIVEGIATGCAESDSS